jgi:HD superfamily phosphohydrolase
MSTWPLQRLRGVSQLALTHLAYPAARHSRFEHSLGAMHVAGSIAEKVELTEREIRRVRLAALVHDVGHGPFSHVSEVPMARLTEAGGVLPSGSSTKNLHEQVTVELLRGDSELRSALASKGDRDWIADTLDTRNEHPPLLIARQIVSGALDADKLDYLMRDSLMAGVRYGVIDLERVVDCCTLWRGQEKQLAMTHYGIPAAEQVLLARYHMTEQVYRHKTRRMTDVMLQRAIMDAASGVAPDEALLGAYVFAPGKKWRGAFLRADDSWLMQRLSLRPADSAAGKLVGRLTRRSLIKEVYRCRVKDLPAGGAEARRRLQREPDLQENLEDRLARLLGTDPDETFLDIRSRENPLHRSPDASPEQEIKIIKKDGTDEQLGGCPESLCREVKVEPETSVFVYAPMDDVEYDAREKTYLATEQKISQEIETWFLEKSNR